MVDDRPVYDVVVVGAGLAGLTGAYELQKRSGGDLQILVLEAKNRVGGRTNTVTLRAANGGVDQWDLGGQWVGRTQLHLLNLLQELKIEIYPQYTDGKKLAEIGNRKIRYYTGTLPMKDLLTMQYSPIELADFAIFMTRVERMAKELDPLDIFRHPKAEEWDSVTVEYWAAQHSWTRTVREAIDAMCFVALGIPANRISLLYLLFYGRRSGSVTDFLEATGNGAQGFRIKGGSQQVSEVLMDKLGGSKGVLLEQAVHRVSYGESWAEIETTNGQVFRAKKLIMAVPPNQAGQIQYDPPLPEVKRQLLTGFPMANLVKFIVTYPKAFWREDGFSGEIVAVGDKVGQSATERPVICTFDATTSYGNPAILGFLSLAWCDKSTSERRDAVLKDLARFLGQKALQYLDYEDKNWSTEPYTGGCPVGILPPGMMRNYQQASYQSVASIHWAGTETAFDWGGYMSGAVQSGLRAAHEILADLRPSAVLAEHLKNTELDPQCCRLRRVETARYVRDETTTTSRLCSTKSVLLISACLFGCYLLTRKFNFDSPIKAKFISSF